MYAFWQKNKQHLCMLAKNEGLFKGKIIGKVDKEDSTLMLVIWPKYESFKTILFDKK